MNIKQINKMSILKHQLTIFLSKLSIEENKHLISDEHESLINISNSNTIKDNRNFLKISFSGQQQNYYLREYCLNFDKNNFSFDFDEELYVNLVFIFSYTIYNLFILLRMIKIKKIC